MVVTQTWNVGLWAGDTLSPKRMNIAEIANPFFPELIRTFEDLAAQKQHDLLLTSTDYDTSRMTTCLRRMLERKVDGVAMMTSEMDMSLIKELSKRNLPIVFMDV